MKKARKSALLFFFTCITCINWAQTPLDTTDPTTPHDPMVINPGKPNDEMVIKPPMPNDEMAVMTDTGFVRRNIIDNLMEIGLSKLAEKSGHSDLVKQIAAEMVEDHTQILNSLKSINNRKLPLTEEQVTSQLASENVELLAVTGKPAFDQIWGEKLLKLHEDKIAELRRTIDVTTELKIQNIARKALPIIMKHRKMLLTIPGVSKEEGTDPLVH